MCAMCARCVRAGAVLLEASFVGAYCSALRLLTSQLAGRRWYLFALGFAKHFLGYQLGLHGYYCERGRACACGRPMKARAAGGFLITDSVLEGLVFCLAGRAAGMFRSAAVGFFVAGAALHIAAEALHVHAMFCKLRCEAMPMTQAMGSEKPGLGVFERGYAVRNGMLPGSCGTGSPAGRGMRGM